MMRYVEETGNLPIHPGVFPGYLLVNFICPECGHKFTGVAAIGTKDAKCPACDWELHTDWLPNARSDIKHDGAWLTGETNFPLMEFDDDDCESDADIYDLSDAPLWAKAYAVLCVLVETIRELFGRRHR